jgi:hypothetical protein
MAQHDYVIANGTGAAVRSDLNSALAAIVSQNSGATAPSTTYAYQWWADTTTGLLKLRNAANNAWITLFQLDGEWSTLAVENGSAAAPSIYFKDSGTDTGIYSPGTDQVAISTGGTGRLFVDSSGRVGLGNSSPSYLLDCKSTGATNVARFLTGATTSSEVAQFGRSDQAVNLSIDYDGAGSMGIGTTTAHPFNLKTGAVTRATIDTSGRLGIGTTTPAGILEIASQDSTNDNGLYITADGSSFGYASNIYFRSKLTTGGSIGVAAKIRAELVSANNAGLLFFTTASGTNSEKARLTHDGKLLVGTSSYAGNGKLIAAGNTGGDAGTLDICWAGSRPTAANTDIGYIRFYSADNSSGNAHYASIYASSDGASSSGSDIPGRLSFATTADGASSPTERMRIDKNGSVAIGASGRPGSLTVTGDVNNNELVLFDNLRTTGGYAEIDFRTAGTERGNIRWETGNVAYNTSSDYRLKENIKPLSDGINLVKQLRPCLFNFIEAGPENTMGGFIAHEVQEVVSYVVSGQKDAVREDGSIKPQCIDQSKLVPLLTAALQEALQKIEDLEARLSVLENI